MEKTISLILADDHEVVRSGIRNALKDLPNISIVGEVSNGLALKSALSIMRPDCLLIDMAMPDLQPIEDVRQIRSEYPNLKILVVSAHDDDIYVQGMLAAGVDGYHLKDQPLADLRLAVQRVISGQRWVTSRLLDKLVNAKPAEDSGPILTSRQKEILLHLKNGNDNQRIARLTGLSVKTVENHLTRIYRQLGVQSRLEAVNYLITHPDLVQEQTVREPAQPPAPPRQTHQQTILIVDDNARFRQQLKRIVESIMPQAAVLEAADTAEALEVARHSQPQLTLVDVVLGNENGIDCTRKLRGLRRPPRVVLMTAYPDREFHRQGLRAGASALLDKKDLDARVLRQIIEDVM
ncbi:MAG: response regulator [Ardenticatenaceae bacterium]|nr:response regulator [Ardenticatenaceae bacterium]